MEIDFRSGHSYLSSNTMVAEEPILKEGMNRQVAPAPARTTGCELVVFGRAGAMRPARTTRPSGTAGQAWLGGCGGKNTEFF